MKKQILFRRHGDVNLIAITEEQFNKVAGKELKHKGSYVLAEGEATGSKHIITVERPADMMIKIGDDGRVYFALSNSGIITHTHDHETITTPKKVWYVQTPEREQDHFANSLTRKVID